MKAVNPAILKTIHKIKSAEVSFLVLILISKMLITGSFSPLTYILAAILHECGHLLTMFVLGCRSCKIRFVGFGIEIAGESVFSYRNEVIVGAMGPIINLACAALMWLLQYCFQIRSTGDFIIASLVYAAINLIPIRPLDGYKIVYNSLCMFVDYNKSCVIMKSITVLCLILLCLVFLIIMVNDLLNLSLILISLILIVSAIAQLIKN